MLKKPQISMKDLRKVFLLFPIAIGSLTTLTLPSCKTYVDGLGTSSTLSSLTANSMGTAGGTSVTFTAPTGTAYSTVKVDQGADFLAANISSGKTIFGLAGSASCILTDAKTVISFNPLLQSNAFRNVSTTQVTQVQEVTTYGGTQGATGSNLPANYRDVPAVNSDDDGYCNADVGGACSGLFTPIVSITWAQHVAFTNCGTNQSTIALRIANCAAINGATATWDGSVKGNSGEGIWKLVTRLSPVGGPCTGTKNTCEPKEVWQDQRTGLLWSSAVAGAQGNGGVGQVGTDNWCKAAGNNETDVICGTGNTQSYCAEVLTPALASENWVANTPGSYTYDKAKGGMGRYSSPTARWRLPTLNDYKLAEVDGIRHVMPDMGAMGGNGEVTATMCSNNHDFPWTVSTYRGEFYSDNSFPRNSTIFTIRCVGR